MVENYTEYNIPYSSGLFIRLISECDFAVSLSFLENIIIFIFRYIGYPNVKSDSRVNRPLTSSDQLLFKTTKQAHWLRSSTLLSLPFSVGSLVQGV
jgi:hypothetical protein